MSNSFDLIIIGAGPGGYVASIRAAQLGLNTALIEKRPHLGGTCLNVGCIPSKALLHSTEILHNTQHEAEKHGIKVSKVSVDLKKLMEKKTTVVDQLRNGVKTLVSKRKVTIFHGEAKLLGNGRVSVSGDEANETIEASNILIATGSNVAELPCLPLDGDTVISSDHAIALEKVPNKLVVVGGGAIGLELGSVWNRLGSEVTVVEFLPEIAAASDPEISKMAARIFKKQGIAIETNTQVTGITQKGKKSFVTAKQGDKELEWEADKILVSVGRIPNTQGLDLETAGVNLDERGRIIVDNTFQTSTPGIYAIGDVIAGPMLAHKAEEEGVAAVEMLTGKAGHVNYDTIPNVIYTEPEIASVGITEPQAKEQNIPVATGKFPLAANGRALASDATEGFVKVIAHAETDKLLGVHIIAKNASELIAPAVTHMEYGGSAEDIARTITAHPTLSESLKEAALAVDKSAIHSL